MTGLEISVRTKGIKDHRSEWKALTIFANCLIAAGQAKSVHGKLVADRAAQLERDFILSQGAASKGRREPQCPPQKLERLTHLAMSIKPEG
jgi:hypothetical protein